MIGVFKRTSKFAIVTASKYNNLILKSSARKLSISSNRMSSINFYYMPESAPCRAVEMAAAELGIELNRKYINLFLKDQLKEEYTNINPLGRVPFIEDGNFSMGESRAIMAYLVNKYKPEGCSLYPKEPEARARVDEVLQFDIGSLFSTGMRLFRPVIFGGFQELDQEAENAFKKNLDYLNKKLEKGGKKFLLGDDVTLGDISILATLSIVEACNYDIGKYGALKAYVNRLKTSIKNYSEINDKPIESMKNFIKSKRA